MQEMSSRITRSFKGKEKVTQEGKVYTGYSSSKNSSSENEPLPVEKLMSSSFKAYTGISQNNPKEVIQYGNISLQVCFNEKQKFRVMPTISVTEKQQCLLDNLWHLQTLPPATAFKVQCLNALSFYFSEQSLKSPEKVSENKRKISYYVVTRGHKLGVFNKWETVAKYVNFPHAIWIGFENFAEAIKAAREQIGPNYYIEPEVVKPFSEIIKQNPEITISQQNNTIRNLQEKVFELQKENAEKEEIIKMLQSSFLKAEQNNANLESKVRRLEKQLDSKYASVTNRSFEKFKNRLIDLPWKETVQPVLEKFPEFEQIISDMVLTEFPELLINLQKKIIEIYFNESKYKGVKVVQRNDIQIVHFTAKERQEYTIPGLLLIQIDLNETNMPDDLILNFYHNGMIDFIEFQLTDNIEKLFDKFGEKFILTAGNIACYSILPKTFCKIISSLPEASAYTYRPARKRIFVTDDKLLADIYKEMYCKVQPCNFDQTYVGEQINHFQQSKNMPRLTRWTQLRLLAEGHYIQIWTTENWKMILPFSGEGDKQEADIINTTEETMMDIAEDHNSDISIPDTHRDY